VAYTPKNKLTKINIGEKSLSASINIPNTIGSVADKKLSATVVQKLLLSEFEQANIEITADKPWGDVTVEYFERPAELITAGFEVFSKVLRSSKIEVSVANDTKYISLSKVFSETSTFTDTNSKLYGKSVIESSVLSEVFSAVYAKRVNDVAKLELQQEFLIEKPFTESTVTYDGIVIAADHDNVELITTSETFSRIVNYLRFFDENSYFENYVDNTRYTLPMLFAEDEASIYVIKIFSDSYLASDVNSKEVEIVKSETTSLLDALSTVSLFNRLFSDWVLTTDDVYGEANLDDDQTAWVTKNVLEEVTYTYLLRNSINKALVELFTSTDSLGNSLIKPFSDSNSFTDLVYSAINKIFTVNTTHSELSSWVFAKAQNEVISTSESNKIDLSVLKLETLTSGEISYASLEKVLRDSGKISETVYNALDKLLSDQSIVADANTLNVNKLLIETSTIAEVVSSVIVKQFNELLLATDDVLGEANIDDDQTAWTTKVLKDDVSFNDYAITVTSFERFPQEIVGTSEVTSFNSSAVKAELVQLVETTSKTLQTVLTESDYFLEQYTQPDYEQGAVVFNEVFNLSPNKGIVDSGAISDSVTDVYFIKCINETLTSYEQLSVTLSYFLNDSIWSTDDFYGEANLDDDQNASFIKVANDLTTTLDTLVAQTTYLRSITDSFVLSEAVSLNTGKSVSDSMSSTDSISLLADFKRSLSDAANNLDILSLSLAKTLQDTTSSSDTITTSTQFNRAAEETFSTSESQVYTIGKQLNETSVLTETLLTAISSVLSDALTLSETLSRSIYKVFSDSSVLSETKWANKQNYMGYNYNLSGYVGTNYTL